MKTFYCNFKFYRGQILDREFGRIKVMKTSTKEIYIESRDGEEIQEQANEVLNKTATVPIGR